MNKLKQLLVQFLLLSSLLIGACPSILVKAEEQGQGLEIVFVVDDSASMQFNDPNKLAGEAVRRFVDLLPAEGDKLGIVTYSYDPLESKDLTTISGQKIKDDFKKFSLEKITQNGRNTDTGTGLLAGSKLFDLTKSDEQKQAIVLLTDGENDFRNRERTEKESNQRLDEVLKTNIPIYTIGLNPQSEDFKKYLTNIADTSGGKVWFPKTSEELNGIIKEVAAELGNVSLANSDIVTVNKDKFTEIKQTVPKDVLEANIQIDHEEPIKLEVVDTDGKTIDLASDQVVLYSEDKYTNVKLLTPKEGDWILKVKSSTKNIQVKVDWIYNYDVEINLNVPETLEVNQENRIQAQLSHKGENFTVEQYKTITADLVVTDKETGQEEVLPMGIDENGLYITKTFDKAGDYQLKLDLTGGNFQKSSEVIDRQVVESQVEVAETNENEQNAGLPLWLKILLGLIGLVLGAGAVLLFLGKSGSKSTLSGDLEIEYIEADQPLHKFSYNLAFFRKKSSVNLEQIIKAANQQVFLGEKIEKNIVLESRGHRSVQIKINKGANAVNIRGISGGFLRDGDEATLSANNSQKIRLKFK